MIIVSNRQKDITLQFIKKYYISGYDIPATDAGEFRVEIQRQNS